MHLFLEIVGIIALAAVVVLLCARLLFSGMKPGDLP